MRKGFSGGVLLRGGFKLIEEGEKVKEKLWDEGNEVGGGVCWCDKDKLFVEKMGGIMEREVGNGEFRVDEFGWMMGVGGCMFYGKVGGVRGYCGNE